MNHVYNDFYHTQYIPHFTNVYYNSCSISKNTAVVFKVHMWMLQSRQPGNSTGVCMLQRAAKGPGTQWPPWGILHHTAPWI